MEHEYIDDRNYITYGDDEKLMFIRRCPECSRFVKANKTVNVGIGLKDEPNAICKKHGAVQMPFLGFF